MATEEVVFRVEVEGQASITEIRKKIKDMRAEYNGLNAAQRENRQDLSKAIVTAKNYVSQAVEPTLSAEAKMRNAYFRTGLQMRQLIMSGGSLNGVLSTVGRNFGLAGIAAAGVVAAGAGVISFFQKNAEEAKKAAEEIKKHTSAIQDLNIEIDKIRGKAGTDFAEAALLEGRVAALQAERTKIETDLAKREATPAAKILKAAGIDVAGAVEGRKRIRDIDIELLGIQKSLAQIDKDRTEELKKQAEIVRRAILEASGPYSLPPKTSPDASFLGRGEVIGGGSIDVSAAVEGMARARQEAQQMRQELQAGAQQFSSTLINALVQGRDLAQSIGLALLGILVNVGTNYLTGGVSSLLGITGVGGGSLGAENVKPSFKPGSIVASYRVKGSDLETVLTYQSRKTGLVTI